MANPLAAGSDQAQLPKIKTHQFLAKENQCVHPYPENRTPTISSKDQVLKKLTTNSGNHWLLRLSSPQAPTHGGAENKGNP